MQRMSCARYAMAEPTKKPARGGLSGWKRGLLTARTILLAVVVHVALAIMLLLGDMTALHILGVLDPGALLFGHHTVGLGLVFDLLHVLLAFFEAGASRGR